MHVFSSAVFEEDVEVLSEQVVVFCNISVITEDIYLKPKTICSLSQGEPIPVGQVSLKFFDIVMPIIRLRIF